MFVTKEILIRSLVIVSMGTTLMGRSAFAQNTGDESDYDRGFLQNYPCAFVEYFNAFPETPQQYKCKATPPVLRSPSANCYDYGDGIYHSADYNRGASDAYLKAETDAKKRAKRVYGCEDISNPGGGAPPSCGSCG